MLTLKAFIDDTTTLCSKENETRRMLIRQEALMNWGRLSFKTKKSRSLSIWKSRLDEDVCSKVASQEISRIFYEPRKMTRALEKALDNATPHSANLTQQWLQRYGWEILPHPAHSPDLAPSGTLFGPLKRHLGGMAFETEDDLISEFRNWFDNLDVDFFRVGTNSLL
ncbi:transposase [Plakobranchus ocellatus]|uniref:Transposase n=1 Tax=Plakobranchus ocellatus TaxID=259542 RepID=A0AAV4AGR7_9GAST|nr:transposase [Plakobranchus ocellatus]